jgi:hypothetical protein
MMVIVTVANALYNKMRESTRKKRKKRKTKGERKSMCVSACSSSDANAFTLPFFLFNYAMRRDETRATDNEGKWRV